MANSNPSWIMTEILCLPLGDRNAQTGKGHPLSKARSSPGLVSLSWTFLLFLFATSSPVNSNLFSISCQMTSSVHVCSVNRQYTSSLCWYFECCGWHQLLPVSGNLKPAAWHLSHLCCWFSGWSISLQSWFIFEKKKKKTSKGIKQRLKTVACTSLSGAIKWTLFTFSCFPVLYRLHLFSSSFDWSSSNLLTPHQASSSLSHQPLWTVPTLNYQSLFMCLDTTWGLVFTLSTGYCYSTRDRLMSTDRVLVQPVTGK